MNCENIYGHIKSKLKDKLIKNLIKDEDFKDLNINDLIENKVNKIVDGDIDFNNMDKKNETKESISGIKRPRLDNIKKDDWTIINIPRFKILSSYIEKENTSIRFQCNDGNNFEYCPRYAYNNNPEFKRWFDEKQATPSGIKYDSGLNKNGELPIKWFGMRENIDYFIGNKPNYDIWMS